MKNILLTSVFFVCILAIPTPTHAQVPFGGLDVFEFPCTCSSSRYTVFAPLFLGMAPASGVMAVLNTPTMFPYHMLHPGAWALGEYTPGVPACWMYVGWGCISLPVMGLMSPFTGTSP